MNLPSTFLLTLSESYSKCAIQRWSCAHEWCSSLLLCYSCGKGNKWTWHAASVYRWIGILFWRFSCSFLFGTMLILTLALPPCRSAGPPSAPPPPPPCPHIKTALLVASRHRYSSRKHYCLSFVKPTRSPSDSKMWSRHRPTDPS